VSIIDLVDILLLASSIIYLFFFKNTRAARIKNENTMKRINLVILFDSKNPIVKLNYPYVGISTLKLTCFTVVEKRY
jgi:hypothetical protein